jgi:hypothetical protein
MNLSPRTLVRPAALALLVGALLPATGLATLLDFNRGAEADAPVMDVVDREFGRWHGSDKLLRVRVVDDGAHLVTPATHPGAWLSTFYAPSPAVLGGDLAARGAVRFALDLRFDAPPANRPSGNTLMIFVGVGGDEPGHALRLNLKDNGALFFVGGGAETRLGDLIAEGKWTRIVAEIDYDAKTVSLRSGDAPAVTGFPFSNDKARANFGRIEFKTDGAPGPYRPLSLDNLLLERIR